MPRFIPDLTITTGGAVTVPNTAITEQGVGPAQNVWPLLELWYTNNFGQVYSDVTTIELLDGWAGMSGDLHIRSTMAFSGAAVLWGTSDLSVHGGSAVFYDSSASARLKLSGSLTIAGSGSAYAPKNGSGFNMGTFSLSATNLDDSSKFDGAAFDPKTGARIALWA